MLYSDSLSEGIHQFSKDRIRFKLLIPKKKTRPMNTEEVNMTLHNESSLI